MSFPVFLLQKFPNQLICCLFKQDDVAATVKIFYLSSQFAIDSSLLEANRNGIIMGLGLSRKTIVYWKCSCAFTDGLAVDPTALESYLTPTLEKILAFNYDYSKAAVFSYNCEIIVYTLGASSLKTDCIVDTGGQIVMAAQFHKHIGDIIIWVSQDRTFRIWNLSEAMPIFQSHILCGAPPCSLALSPLSNQMALSFANGIIIGYSLQATRGTRSEDIPTKLFQADLPKKVTSFMAKNGAATTILESVSVSQIDKASLHKPLRKVYFSYVYPSDPSENAESDEIDTHILATLYYSKHLANNSGEPSLNIHGNKHYSDDIRSVAQYFLILLPSKIIQLNIANLEIEQVVALPQNAMSGHFVVYEDLKEPYCVITASETITVISLDSSARNTISPLVEDHNLASKLNVIATEGLAANSVLRTTKVTTKSPNEPPPQLYKSSREMFRQPGTLDKKGKIVDKQPITFHNKVKSSGYASSGPKPSNPRKQLVKPFSSSSTRSTKDSSSKPPISKFSDKLTSASNAYPMSGPPPSELTAFMTLTERPTCTTWLQPTFDGKRIAFSMSDGLVGIASSKLMANPRVFVHHRQCVRRVSWSKCGNWLTACCDDGTASFWAVGTGERLLELTEESRLAKKPINHIQFYYVDEFVIATIGNSLNLYSCALTTEKSDIKRYQANSVFKKVSSFSIENAVSITAANAANTFHSYLILCAASDRSLNIFDVNVGHCLVKLPEAHSRPANCIAITGDSVQNAAVPQPVYNLYATSSVGDAIKLWDVREASPVRCFQGHNNRSCPFISVAFSPCARFIATGSEDRSAYVFDIRADRPLSRLDGGVLPLDQTKPASSSSSSSSNIHHCDTVTCVAFNSSRPQLFAATLDGKLYRYSQSSSSS